MLPDRVLLAPESSFETRVLLKACTLQDIAVQRVDAQDLAQHQVALAGGRVLPAGSVEYVREAMRVAGVPEPDNLSYHPSIRRYLGRPIHEWIAGELLAIPIPRPIFVKPQTTKRFTGFVLDPKIADSQYAEHDRSQMLALRALPPDEMLWTSPAVEFVAEWRYYVLDSKQAWCARYDDGAEDAPSPDQALVSIACHSAWLALGHPFALDIGVLRSGATVVVELNDAWAVGLYSGGLQAISAPDYLHFLFARWLTLFPQRA